MKQDGGFFLPHLISIQRCRFNFLSHCSTINVNNIHTPKSFLNETSIVRSQTLGRRIISRIMIFLCV